jgi:ubiquinone/menaquinone biosynthesis C-methylase UbiE
VASADERSRVIRERYSRIARSYDRRWASYISATTRETLGRLNLRPGERVLDVGCGTGELAARITESTAGVQIFAADLAPAMLRQAREKLAASSALAEASMRLVAADAIRLPFADRTFDVVVSSSSFHYWSSPEAGLAEVRRVLRPGGRVVLTDWCDDYLACRVCDFVLRLIEPAHHRAYGSQGCDRLLRGAGFSAVRVERYRVSWLWGMMTGTAKMA